VPINKVPTPALVNNDRSAANANTNSNNIPETTSLLKWVKYITNIGMSRIVTAIQTAANLPTSAILASEKKYTSGLRAVGLRFVTE